MLSAPTSTAPVDSSRAISVASRLAGARSRLIFEPASVGSPAMSNKFLTANGTPASAPTSRRPFARSASSAAALASALLGDGGERKRQRQSRSRAPKRCPLERALGQLGREDGRQLGVVRQREIREQGRERERHFEIGFDRALPCRLELKIKRLRPPKRSSGSRPDRLPFTRLPLARIVFVTAARDGLNFPLLSDLACFVIASCSALLIPGQSANPVYHPESGSPQRCPRDASVAGCPSRRQTGLTAHFRYAKVGWGMAARRSRVYCACGETRISSVGPCSTMRPACMTMTRSHNRRTTLRSWETNR